MQHHNAFIEKTRTELAGTQRCSKSWWSKARQLLDQKSKTSSIPVLKHGSDWCLDARQKVDIFAGTFERKHVMIKEEVNDYLEIKIIREAPIQACLPTIETTEKILTQLDAERALGPDMLPTRILKRCAAVIAPLLHTLILMILHYG